MAETNVTNVGGDTPLDGGDNLSETALREYIAQTNLIDYVIRGCGFSVDFGANTVDIGNTNTRGNFAVLSDSNLAYPVFPDQATGVSLPNTNGQNYVFLAYDTANDEIDYHVDTEDTAPSGPALKIGTIDTSGNTSTELNRRPPGQGGPLVAASIDDGDSPYTTQGEEIIFVDTSNAPVTVELATQDVTQGKEIIIVDDADNAATNNITVSTEGSETIDPDADNTKSIDIDGGRLAVSSNGSDWRANEAIGELAVTTLGATTANVTTANIETLANSTSAVSIGDSLVPDTTDTHELGSASSTYSSVYTGNVSGGGSQVSVGDSLVPDTTDTHELGSASSTYSSVYTGNVSGGGSQVDVGDSLIPDADNTHDLGSASFTWNETFTDTVDAGTVTADGVVIDDTYHWASQYDGADADARLDNAVSTASDGDTIYLENADYSSNHTFGKQLTVVGARAKSFEAGGPRITGSSTWTFNSRFWLTGVGVDNGSEIAMDGAGGRAQGVELRSSANITVAADQVTISHVSGNGTITFESGTSDGETGVITGGATVTDNGTNDTL